MSRFVLVPSFRVLFARWSEVSGKLGLAKFLEGTRVGRALVAGRAAVFAGAVVAVAPGEGVFPKKHRMVQDGRGGVERRNDRGRISRVFPGPSRCPVVVQVDGDRGMELPPVDQSERFPVDQSVSRLLCSCGEFWPHCWRNGRRCPFPALHGRTCFTEEGVGMERRRRKIGKEGKRREKQRATNELGEHMSVCYTQHWPFGWLYKPVAPSTSM